eukprot:4711439-Prymnesium_polylepis.3
MPTHVSPPVSASHSSWTSSTPRSGASKPPQRRSARASWCRSWNSLSGRSAQSTPESAWATTWAPSTCASTSHTWVPVAICSSERLAGTPSASTPSTSWPAPSSSCATSASSSGVSTTLTTLPPHTDHGCSVTGASPTQGRRSPPGQSALALSGIARSNSAPPAFARQLSKSECALASDLTPRAAPAAAGGVAGVDVAHPACCVRACRQPQLCPGLDELARLGCCVGACRQPQLCPELDKLAR